MKKLIAFALCVFVQYSHAKKLESPTGSYTNRVVNHTNQDIYFALTDSCQPGVAATTLVQPGQTADYTLSEGRPEGQFLYIDGACEQLPVCHEVFLGNVVHVYPDRIETQM
jgi:hypothetical protein